MSPVALARRGGEGPPLVLVHGWASHSGVWDAVARELAGHFSLYLADLPGHGASAEPGEDDPLEKAAQEILSCVPPEATWVGWSLGGLVALSAAREARGGVGRLVLVASTPRFVSGPDWPHGVPVATLESFAEDLGRDLEGTLARFIALQTRGSERATQVARALRQMLREGPAPSGAGLRRGLHWLRESDLRDALRRVACPVHVLLGERDTLVPPECLGDILALRPDAEGTVLPGSGHAPFLSDPRGFSDFLLRGCLRVA